MSVLGKHMSMLAKPLCQLDKGVSVISECCAVQLAGGQQAVYDCLALLTPHPLSLGKLVCICQACLKHSKPVRDVFKHLHQAESCLALHKAVLQACTQCNWQIC